MHYDVYSGGETVPAMFCKERYALISRNGTPIGTKNLFHCTGLVVFRDDNLLHHPCAVGHVEAQSGAGPYAEHVGLSLAVIVDRMRLTNAAQLTLVMLGASASGMSADPEATGLLSEAIAGVGFSLPDVIDLRNKPPARIGGRRPDGLPDTTFTGCILYPEAGRLRLLGMLGSPAELASGAELITIQRDERVPRKVPCKGITGTCVFI